MSEQPDSIAAILHQTKIGTNQSRTGSRSRNAAPTVQQGKSSDWPQNLRRDAPENLSEATWSEIKPGLRSAISETVKHQRWPLLIHGPAGTGKSCASACVYRMWNPIAYWYRLEHFVRDVQVCRSSEKKVVRHIVAGQSVYRSEAKLWEFVENPQAIWCIDDVGTKAATESAFDIIFDLIDKRTGLPMILTSNHGVEQLATVFDARIADRLSAGTVVELTGQSRRKGKRVTV